MLRPGQPLGPEKILEFRAKAKVLGLNLEHELAALSVRHSGDPALMRDIDDFVYLPTAVALAEGLATFNIPELDLLRQRFCPDLAATQLGILIGLLHKVAEVLGEVNF